MRIYLVIFLLAAVGAAQNATHDYIIVGASTAGLLLAVVLTENPNISVLVLEAGGDARNTPNVTDPERRGTIQHTEYDWGLETTLQPYLFDNGTGGSQYVPRGKTIGGTSAMNWMIHNEDSRVQLDIWESLLNLTGWNYASMSAAFRQSETMYAPPAYEARYLPYDAEDHGGAGYIRSTFQRSVFTLYSDYVQPSLEASGWPKAHDGNDGDARGPNFLPLAINRPNLQVQTNKYVTQVLWNSTTGNATASGVRFIDTGGTNCTHEAYGRHIVLSAGIIQSPQILQHSGVGDPLVLSPLGIKTIVHDENVGTSLRDPPMMNYLPISFQLNETAAEAANLTGDQYIQNLIDLEPASISLAREDYAAASAWLNETDVIPGLPDAQFAVFKELWYTEQPLVEFAWQYQVANVTPYNLVPLSQGTVRINSSDPTAAPAINPNYNAAAQHYTAVLATAEPMAGLITGTIPDYRLPFDQWYDAVFRQTGSSQHLTGGNPMLPREAGGAVDASLLVYGTTNVRVVDGSVFPYQPSAHPMGVTYALAVRAASIFQQLEGGGGLTKTTRLPVQDASLNAVARFPGDNPR
ncbi:hypothetical protein G7054_g13737 [Neopestalotiopsis clavispora]|nr:hypothetical protein G7054_g13737 [Neopestalotiopsis clavispora]